MGFPSGKEVDATKWWLPDPDKDSATELTFEHSRNLTVYDSPGHRFAEKLWGNGSGSQKVQHFGEIKQKRTTISRQPLVYTGKTQRIWNGARCPVPNPLSFHEFQ